ncbi:MAG: HipA N-terminal domain-containing protein [Bacteroidota bacterium]
MRQLQILYKGEKAGQLTQNNDGSFVFEYDNDWLDNQSKPSISLTLPKRRKPYESEYLFSLFYNMLPEGSNRQVVCKYNKIDVEDYFGILAVTAQHDNIGAISVKRNEG